MVWLLSAGCASLGGGLAVRAPAADRCSHWAEPLARRGCDRIRDRARSYLETLHVGDAICLDPPLQEDMDSGCRARGRIDDQGSNSMRITLIEVEPSSGFAPQANQHLWYENLALVDLYLKEKGF